MGHPVGVHQEQNLGCGSRAFHDGLGQGLQGSEVTVVFLHVATAIIFTVDLGESKGNPGGLLKGVGAIGFRDAKVFDLLVHLPLRVLSDDVGEDVHRLVTVQGALLHHGTDGFRQQGRVDGLLDDDLQHVAHRVTADHVAIQTEQLDATLMGQVHQGVACHQQLLEGFTGSDPDSGGFNLRLNGTFDLAKGLFHLAAHTLLLRHLLQRVVVDGETEEGTVGWQQGQQELGREVVHPTGTKSLEGGVELGLSGVPIRGHQGRDRELCGITGTAKEGITLALKLAIPSSGCLHRFSLSRYVQAVASGTTVTSDVCVDTKGGTPVTLALAEAFFRVLHGYGFAFGGVRGGLHHGCRCGRWCLGFSGTHGIRPC